MSAVVSAISKLEYQTIRGSLEVQDLLKQLVKDNAYRFDVPPAWVLKAAKSNRKGIHYWDQFYQVLCQWYHVANITAIVDTSIQNCIANYSGSEFTVRSKTTSMTNWTGLHEFFHHLCYVKRSGHNGEAEQALADAFATECVRIMELPT